ncbi:peptidyl-prolyl cis-trans isomerase-like 1 [Euwallacea similis]|uniref:peptidyl-prolyl cis-trans isomerase-like 1 n=1 Tax=Euwallacea similis TaxID=1736056 RepID=UPI00344E0FE6
MIATPVMNQSGIPDKMWQPPLVQFETTMGEFVVELYWKHAPQTCRNFAELTRRGYYNNTVFHRVIRDFMIQGGDPTGTGKGGTSIYGPSFKDEIHPELKHSGAGIVSMANSGPDSNGSQFFITLAPTEWLDGKHAVFGRIHSGMQVVKRVGMVETDKSDHPVDEIKILRGKVLKS